MAAPRRKSPGDTTPDDTQGFESSLAELEKIVAEMEEQQLPLEELVSRYEKGSKLLARCENVLASARKRLQTIQSGTEPEDPSGARDADDETPGAPVEPDDDDDIRLF